MAQLDTFDGQKSYVFFLINMDRVNYSAPYQRGDPPGLLAYHLKSPQPSPIDNH